MEEGTKLRLAGRQGPDQGWVGVTCSQREDTRIWVVLSWGWRPSPWRGDVTTRVFQSCWQPLCSGDLAAPLQRNYRNRDSSQPPCDGRQKGGDVQETGNPDKAKDLTHFPALWNMHTFRCVKAPLNPGPHLSVSTLKIKVRNCEVMCLGLARPAKVTSDYQSIA